MKLAMSSLFFSYKVLKNITFENKFYVVIIVHAYYILTVLEEMHIYLKQLLVTTIIIDRTIFYLAHIGIVLIFKSFHTGC